MQLHLKCFCTEIENYIQIIEIQIHTLASLAVFAMLTNIWPTSRSKTRTRSQSKKSGLSFPLKTCVHQKSGKCRKASMQCDMIRYKFLKSDKIGKGQNWPLLVRPNMFQVWRTGSCHDVPHRTPVWESDRDQKRSRRSPNSHIFPGSIWFGN